MGTSKGRPGGRRRSFGPEDVRGTGPVVRVALAVRVARTDKCASAALCMRSKRSDTSCLRGRGYLRVRGSKTLKSSHLNELDPFVEG